MRISDWSSDVCSSDLQAPNRVDDDRAVQRHPVVGPGLVAPLGQPEFIERRIEQIARIIAGERPPGAIRALLARREPDDRAPRVWVTEGGHRRVPPLGELGAQFPTERDERSEEHTSELPSLMRISSAVFCLKKTN